MDFALDAQADQLRDRLRSFLRDHHPGRPPKGRENRRAWAKEWARTLADHGFAGPAWPQAWGGMELSLSEQIAYYEEMAQARLPPQPAGLKIVGPTILRFGSPEQQQRYLPPMVRSEEDWCLGYSEPGSGSDLASLRTRAERDGDEYVVNGQKVWTSNSMTADFMVALVRTGTAASRQHGITYLIVDMRTPGIEIRPLQDMTGDIRFSEVFFQDVRVPVGNVVGAENAGWTVARTALGYERSTANTARDLEYRRVLDDLVKLAQERGRSGEPRIRQELARLETTIRLLHLNNIRMLSAVLRGEEPGSESSVTRLMHSLFEKRLHEFALDLLGADGLLAGTDPLAPQRGRWAWGFLRTRASTIGAGTSEVQRNVLGERVLGLPHEPDSHEPSASVATEDRLDGAVRHAAGSTPTGHVRLSIQTGPPIESEHGVAGRPVTLGGLLREISARDPEHDAIVTSTERLTFRELRDRSERIARALVAHGAGKSSRVAILLPNGPDWVAAYFGVTMIGAVAITLNTFAPDDDIEYMVGHSDAQMLLTNERLIDRLQESELLRRHPLLVPGASASRDDALPAFVRAFHADDGSFLSAGEEVSEATLAAMAQQVEPDDDAMIMFTSGSTGRSKGVLHVHRAVCIQCWRWAVVEDHSPSDRVWTTAPFFWSSGLVRSMGGPLAAGATLVLQEHFEPGAALELLERERVTTILSRPHLDLRMLEQPSFADHDLSSVRKVYEQSPLRQRLLPGEVVSGHTGAYGMTETMTIVSYGRDEVAERVGHGGVLPGMTVRIVDPETGAVTPLGTAGRICLRGATLMRGYVMQTSDDVFDDDGFFATSDSGFLDERGRLHWTGRLDNVIKVAGVNVSPIDVERQLAGWDRLHAFSVFPLPHPTLGAALILCAAPGDSIDGVAPVDEDQIREHLRGKLATYQLPRRIVLVSADDVPFTSTLKVNVKALQTLALERLLDELDEDWLAHVKELQASGKLPSGS